ncbi:MAG: 30S ribosomal protein S7, partial [Synechococcales cyanobacterium]
MSRRSSTQKRPIIPDPVHSSRLVSMMVSRIMKSGKKSIAFHIIYSAFSTIKERTGNDPLEVFEKA